MRYTRLRDATLRRGGPCPGIDVERDLVQEDWGVVIYARLARHRHWLGLSFLDEHHWLAHVHRAPFAGMTAALDHALRQGNASELKWFDERDSNLRSPASSPD
jgi:hypothetical protein